MSSRTATVASASQIRGLHGVLSSSRFVPCFGQYQSALAAAAIPGSTAQVQPVTLGGPSGVTSFGVVTTVASPSQGTEVVGDAFILGGRVLTVLQPVTTGAPIPPRSLHAGLRRGGRPGGRHDQVAAGSAVPGQAGDPSGAGAMRAMSARAR